MRKVQGVFRLRLGWFLLFFFSLGPRNPRSVIENGSVTLKFLLVSLALVLAPCLACAQSFTVNGPFDPGTYKALDGAQRWHRWASEDGVSGSIHIQSFAAAAYTQMIDDPSAWGRTTGGFVRRAGSSYGSNLIENTVH
jgi:hypothetical protein